MSAPRPGLPAATRAGPLDHAQRELGQLRLDARSWADPVEERAASEIEAHPEQATGVEVDVVRKARKLIAKSSVSQAWGPLSQQCTIR